MSYTGKMAIVLVCQILSGSFSASIPAHEVFCHHTHQKAKATFAVAFFQHLVKYGWLPTVDKSSVRQAKLGVSDWVQVPIE
jgi:hypothetical protein